ncbi:hypothetical protein D3C86_1800110 [compost metagenome]
MPEAVMDEDHFAQAGKDKTGYAGQIASVQAKAVAEGTDEAAAAGELGAVFLPRTRGKRSERAVLSRVSTKHPRHSASYPKI